MFRFCRRTFCAPKFSLTLSSTCPAAEIRGNVLFTSKNASPCTIFSNESFPSSQGFRARVVWMDLQQSCGYFGVFPAALTDLCAAHRIGTASLTGSVACRVGSGQIALVSGDRELVSIPHDCKVPLLLDLHIGKDGVPSFRVDGQALQSPALSAVSLSGDLRIGVSTMVERQVGALSLDSGHPREEPTPTSSEKENAEVTLNRILRDVAAHLHSSESPAAASQEDNEAESPETGFIFSDTVPSTVKIAEYDPIVALTPTVLRCAAAEDGTAYVPVPIGTEERAAIGVSVRFTGLNKGYAGCGFFKKEALDAGDAQQCLLGKTEHSIGCLLKNGEVLVFINGKRIFCGDTPKSDELTMHFSFDRKKGMHVRIEKGVVNCDEFKDLSIFDGDLYFGVSLSEEGQLARFLPSGLGAPRFHYGMNSMDVDEDKLMSCKHSVCASLSAHERWYGDAEKAFVMRVTNVCREPIGIGLVSAKLWNNGRRNMVGSTEFGPYSIGLVVKDRRIYIHHQDEFIEWKPLGRMPLIPKNVDLMMRVSGGKVSFFYQGVPVIMPVVSDLTLPADERFRAAYTMSDRGQTAVIPPNVPVRAAQDLTKRYSLVGDAAHVALADGARKATALFTDALCFSTEAFALTPSPWDAYARGCSECQCAAKAARGTLWLCPRCGVPDEFALCDGCYWNASLASKHDHARDQFIPLLGAGSHEMRIVLEETKDSYIEVGVTPASYEDGFGSFAQNTTVVLGNVSPLVKAAMPAGKIVEKCPTLKKGDIVCVRVVDAELSVLVNEAIVFQTTLSADAPFLNQGLRFGVRMGAAGQVIRAEAPSS